MKNDKRILAMFFEEPKVGDYLNANLIVIFFVGLWIFMFAVLNIQYYRQTQSEIARFEDFTKNGSLKPTRGEIQVSPVIGEFGACMEMFKTGTITFSNGCVFFTDNESAFRQMAKRSLSQNPNFAIECHEDNTVP